jgi:hypothetical protein
MNESGEGERHQQARIGAQPGIFAFFHDLDQTTRF